MISIQIHLDQSKVGSRPYRVRSVQQNFFGKLSCKACTEKVDDNLSSHLPLYQEFMANMSLKGEKFGLILHFKLKS